jgi:hypothetical protein
MSFTITAKLPEYAGIALTLRITNPGSATRVNGDADDAFVDSASNFQFSATVAENLVGSFDYVIFRGSSVVETGSFCRKNAQTSVVIGASNCESESASEVTPGDGSLQSIRDNILARIAEVTAAPKPNYNIDGQSVSWQTYLDSLFAALEKINDQINASEPYEFVSRGVT